jgi:hypothetical protein
MCAKPLFDVIEVSYLSGYRLLVVFDNHERKIVNLEQQVKEAAGTRFEELKEMDYFKTVRLDKELDTITWENGYDVCPHLLYQLGEAVRGGELLEAL